MLVAWISRSRLRLRVVEWRRAHLLEQLFDHGADPHHLGRLLDQVGQRPVIGVFGINVPGGRHQPGIDAADDLDIVVIVAVTQSGSPLVLRRLPSSPCGSCRGATPFVNPGPAIVVDLRPPLRLVY